MPTSPDEAGAQVLKKPAADSRLIKNWVLSHLSEEFHVPIDRISPDTSLLYWGYASTQA